MKTKSIAARLFFLGVFLISGLVSCFGQDLDSLKSKILLMDSKLTLLDKQGASIEIRIDKFKDQHQQGMMLMIPAALIFLGEIYINGNTFKNDSALLYASSAAFVTGFVISFDSFKHLDKRNFKKRNE